MFNSRQIRQPANSPHAPRRPQHRAGGHDAGASGPALPHGTEAFTESKHDANRAVVAEYSRMCVKIHIGLLTSRKAAKVGQERPLRPIPRRSARSAGRLNLSVSRASLATILVRH